ncbi:sulfatase family protein [Rhodotorula paludigena]|uniref:sulfatase family protein n=1 Tax=Rhodotorula paludigena TaxID=86838 RepID=UPI00318144B6
MVGTAALTAGLVALAPALACASALPRNFEQQCKADKKPNIVFIISDDQDMRQDSLGSMPRLQKLLVKEGTKFERFYSPISICCPSRSAFLRAQVAHSTNITDVRAPYGGWPLFNEFGYNGHWLPSFLEQAEYDVRYVGKLMNGQTTNNTAALPAQGLVDSAFLLDPHTYDFWNPAFSTPAGPVEYRFDEYSNDVVTEKALKFLDDAAQSPDKPFFVGIAPIAPHSHIAWNDTSRAMQIPIPHPRHANMFPDAKLDRSRDSFNPDVPSGASWVRKLDKLSDENVDYIEDFYRARLQALQSVDEMVEQVVQKLENMGVLDETMIIYTSDNGFESNAGHRRQPGKTLPYEEDINVPLVVRGPGVPKGKVDKTSVYSLTDLAATILHVSGAQADFDHDGAVMPLTHELRKRADWNGGAKQFHLSEYWVENVIEGKYAKSIETGNATYRGVRVVEGDDIDYAYAVWCTNEHEIYDMKKDPNQMHNIALNDLSPTSWHGRLHTRLDALLLVLKQCSGESCRNPWRSIFTNGKVTTLKQALDRKYDDYFAQLPRVKYDKCELGYHRGLEAPFWSHNLAYSPGQCYRQKSA